MAARRECSYDLNGTPPGFFCLPQVADLEDFDSEGEEEEGGAVEEMEVVLSAEERAEILYVMDQHVSVVISVMQLVRAHTQ